eukprot:gene13043-8889_t
MQTSNAGCTCFKAYNYMNGYKPTALQFWQTGKTLVTKQHYKHKPTVTQELQPIQNQTHIHQLTSHLNTRHIKQNNPITTKRKSICEIQNSIKTKSTAQAAYNSQVSTTHASSPTNTKQIKATNLGNIYTTQLILAIANSKPKSNTIPPTQIDTLFGGNPAAQQNYGNALTIKPNTLRQLPISVPNYIDTYTHPKSPTILPLQKPQTFTRKAATNLGYSVHTQNPKYTYFKLPQNPQPQRKQDYYYIISTLHGTAKPRHHPSNANQPKNPTQNQKPQKATQANLHTHPKPPNNSRSYHTEIRPHMETLPPKPQNASCKKSHNTNFKLSTTPTHISPKCNKLSQKPRCHKLQTTPQHRIPHAKHRPPNTPRSKHLPYKSQSEVSLHVYYINPPQTRKAVAIHPNNPMHPKRLAQGPKIAGCSVRNPHKAAVHARTLKISRNIHTANQNPQTQKKQETQISAKLTNTRTSEKKSKLSTQNHKSKMPPPTNCLQIATKFNMCKHKVIITQTYKQRKPTGHQNLQTAKFNHYALECTHHNGCNINQMRYELYYAPPAVKHNLCVKAQTYANIYNTAQSQPISRKYQHKRAHPNTSLTTKQKHRNLPWNQQINNSGHAPPESYESHTQHYTVTPKAKRQQHATIITHVQRTYSTKYSTAIQSNKTHRPPTLGIHIKSKNNLKHKKHTTLANLNRNIHKKKIIQPHAQPLKDANHRASKQQTHIRNYNPTFNSNTKYILSPALQAIHSPLGNITQNFILYTSLTDTTNSTQRSNNNASENVNIRNLAIMNVPIPQTSSKPVAPVTNFHRKMKNHVNEIVEKRSLLKQSANRTACPTRKLQSELNNQPAKHPATKDHNLNTNNQYRNT